MTAEEKAIAKSQSNLIDILGCSRTQAWRIWNGKSSLTNSNRKLLEIYANEEITTKQQERKRDI